MSMDGRQKDAEGKLRHSGRVQVRVSSDAAEEVIAEARHQRRTIAEMLRVIVEEWADGRRSRKP